MNSKKAYLLLVMATFFWGTTFSLTKYLTDYFSTLSMIAIRFFIATVVTWLVYQRPLKASLIKLKTMEGIKQHQNVFMLGVLNVVAILMQTEGVREIPATNSGFITSLAIIFVPFFEVIYTKRPISGKIIGVIIIALGGVYLMSFGWALPQQILKGDLYTLLSALIYSYYIVLVTVIAKQGISAQVMMFWNFLITSVLTVMVALFYVHDPWILRPLDYNTILIFLFLSVVATVVPYLCMGLGQKEVTPTKAAIIYLLEPIFAAIIAMLFIHETITLMQLIGAAIILSVQFYSVLGPAFIKHKNC
ncbi:MAG: hypothetical protein A2381_06585 [Bdellovibrionales bacterium RIFOXYB1_FULL_37_110]|nr:MAG: hypothetical protein A2181_08605 [Bdellovibrionales bacterium RIFOXYA1_FULL_38_20]OFZ50208.1 MAG: hypothetical protein A2417_19435 [Bdellovibrionales bacterium RIFOXYC1_FULL_37_79]OFZ57645.1 MAG: hypothetical protein A2381_06585 [Bdellovibrionales bacterium RIFOXYB1_FULL_37_110]OFZ61412.1 MAG: hypothetical protein A2577_00950 [Bdellovibrionales bacterium RIFOXYD1_FULL_36_51]